MKQVEEQLLPSQKKLVESIANKLVNLNYEQIRYFMNKIAEPEKKLVHIAPITYEPSWPKAEDFKEFPKEASFQQKEELMKELAGWYKKHLPNFGLGRGVAAQAIEVKKQEKKEEKTEEVKEKEIVDVELTAFDAAKKINLIKEVKNILNLGLKEVILIIKN
jgi:large subunit ribosomal protein L7/L12